MVENILKRGESAGEVGVDPIFKKGWVRYRRGCLKKGGWDPLTSYVVTIQFFSKTTKDFLGFSAW